MSIESIGNEGPVRGITPPPKSPTLETVRITELCVSKEPTLVPIAASGQDKPVQELSRSVTQVLTKTKEKEWKRTIQEKVPEGAAHLMGAHLVQENPALTAAARLAKAVFERRKP